MVGDDERALIGEWAREGRRDLPRPALELLDRRLVELGRGVGGMRLRMGEALEAFARCCGSPTARRGDWRGPARPGRVGRRQEGRKAAGPHEMGFPGLGAYARERCARSEHWAADSRALARRVEGLPRVREAVLSGRLSWSQAELVVRVATPEDEAAWVEEAEGLTVRALKQRIQSGQAQAPAQDEEEDEAPPRRVLQVTVDREDAWAFEATKMLVAAVTGSRAGGAATDVVVEAMLAEGLTALMEARPDLEVPEGLDPEEARLAAEWRAQVDRWRREAEVACEDRIPEPPPLDGIEVEDEPLPEGPRALDRHMRRLAAALGARDLEMGDAARCLFASNGWRRLGYASVGQYVRERAGVSKSSLERRMTLSRRAGRLPEVGEALRAGRVGYEAARLVARVARPETAAAWLDRAEVRTFKHLREDVEAVEMVARMSGQRGPLAPPDQEAMEAVAGMERFVLRMALRDEAPEMSGGSGEGDDGSTEMSGGPGDGDEDAPEMSGGANEDDEGAPEMSGGVGDRDGPPLRPGAGRVTIRLRLRDDLWTFWRVLRRLHARSGVPGPFVAFLCTAVWRSWRGACEAGRAYREPLLRDRFRCSSPVCGRRDTTPHHVVFRSRGGGDEDENIVALCSACHLDGVHGGVMQVDGKAPELTWRVGRDGELVVRGREVVARAA